MSIPSGSVTSNCRTEKSRNWIGPGHLLENGNEESDLHLSRVLEETVERRRTFGLGKDTEPYVKIQVNRLIVRQSL
jgi:hypothetical protein